MTRAFKTKEKFNPNDPFIKFSNDRWNMKQYVNFIKEYIDENYSKEIQLKDLATIVHVSVSYLSICFKREMGVSFTEYLVRYRINKAKEILLEKNITCKEAAYYVGYEDYVQFSKMFKKYIGCTPTQIQKDKINTTK